MRLVNKIENIYKNNPYKKIIFFILLFLCGYSTFVLLVPGIASRDDMSFHLSRIYALKEEVLIGEFPIKIYSTYLNGYGYANGLFYPDIFLYIPVILCLLGLNVLVSYKIFIVICTLSSALAIYYCVKEISKSNFAATVSMILCTLSAYRIVDVHQRAALGEVLSFIFVPIVILGIYKIFYENYKQWYILSLGFSGLLLSHLISSVMMASIIAFIIILTLKMLMKEPKRILYFLLSICVTILLVSFFLFPLIEQLINHKFILNAETIHSVMWETQIPLTKLFLEMPNFFLGHKIPSGIGIAFLVIILLRMKIKRNNTLLFRFLDLCLFVGIISLLAVSELFPWKYILNIFGELSAIQFAWRFYLFATIFLSISSGLILFEICTNLKKKIIALIFIFVFSLFASSINLLSPYLYYIQVGIMSDKVTAEGMVSDESIGMKEYLPYDTKMEKILQRGSVITSNNSNIIIEHTKEGTNMNIQFKNNKTKDTYIELPLLYYQGYETIYESDRKKEQLKVSKGENNIIRIDLENYESGSINVKYEGTKIQKISLFISFITLLLFIVYLFYSKKVKKENEVVTHLENE